MSFSLLLKQLIDALTLLPGVGNKSAQRMALHVLERDKEGGLWLAQCLTKAIKQLGHCQQCRILSEKNLCDICSNHNRDHTTLCVVEGPQHLMAVEQTGFTGVYFVLSGHLSPIDGIGPTEIGIDVLHQYLESTTLREVVLATNSTVEGEATAYFIADIAKKKGLKTTRIAHGVPMGGELDYIDGGTLAKALADRMII